VGTTTNLRIILNTQKNPYLNQATKKILAKFSYPKKYRNQKFQTQKKSFDHPRHLESRVPPLGMAAKEVKEDKIDVVVKVEIGIQH